MTAVAPCNHPQCHDLDGNPRLTTTIMCPGCQRRTRQTLDHLLLDYATLRTQYPTPTSNTPTRRAPRREYGHPAEWASDTARHIADLLDLASEALRDHLGHLPPPPRQRSETRVINHAYTTLTTRLTDFCTQPGATDTITELNDLHHRIRAMLGHTRQRTLLPAPCPTCGSIGVTRTVNNDRSDTIECEHCGRTISEAEYGLYARILIDDLLDQPDPT